MNHNITKTEAPSGQISSSSSSQYVRLLVCAIGVETNSPAKKEANSQSQKEDDTTKTDKKKTMQPKQTLSQIQRFVFPIKCGTSVKDLRKKISSRFSQKINGEGKSANLCDVYILDQNDNVDNSLAKSGQNLDRFFDKLYQIDGEKVGDCFRDFDKVVARCVITASKKSTDVKISEMKPLIKKREKKANDKEQKEDKEDNKTQQNPEQTDDTTKKVGKNAKKKAQRKEEKTAKETEEQKADKFRLLLQDSINGYSQEEAAKTISSQNSDSMFSESQSNHELENLLKTHQDSECQPQLIDLND